MVPLFFIAAGLLSTASAAYPPSATIAACIGGLSNTATLVQPLDPSFVTIKRAINARSVDINPALIVLAKTEADIVASVKCAASLQVPLNTRAGGHSYEIGYDTDGILLDLNDYNVVTTSLESDPPTVTIQTGARTARVHGTYMKNSLASSRGPVFLLSTPNNLYGGVSGHTLCGGFGTYGRSVGMASDQVLSFRVVTSSGAVITADANQNTDIYWALRGSCSSSFGVVSQITFQLSVLPDTSGTAYVTHVQFPVSFNQRAAALTWVMTNGHLFNNKISIGYSVGTNYVSGIYMGPLSEALANTWSNTNGPNFQSLAAILGITSTSQVYFEKDRISSVMSEFKGMTLDEMIGVTSQVTQSDFRVFRSSMYFTSVPPASLADKMLRYFANPPLLAALEYRARNGYGSIARGDIYTDDAYGPLVRGMLFEIEVSAQSTFAIKDDDSVMSLNDFNTDMAGFRAGAYADSSAPFFEAKVPNDFFGVDNKLRLQSIRAVTDPSGVFKSRNSLYLYPLPADAMYSPINLGSTVAPTTTPLVYVYNAFICDDRFMYTCSFAQLQEGFCVGKKGGCGVKDLFCNANSLWTISCALAIGPTTNPPYFEGDSAGFSNLVSSCQVSEDCGHGFQCQFGICSATSAPANDNIDTSFIQVKPVLEDGMDAATVGGLTIILVLLSISMVLVVYSKVRKDDPFADRDFPPRDTTSGLQIQQTTTTPNVTAMTDGRTDKSPLKLRQRVSSPKTTALH